MSEAVTVLRIAIQDSWGWPEVDRDLTINQFIYELSAALTEASIELMAKEQSERFVTMFTDWARYRKKRGVDHRIAMIIRHVARNAPGTPFGYENAMGNKDVEEAVSAKETNVVSLFHVR